jgi:hypothetical protein
MGQMKPFGQGVGNRSDANGVWVFILLESIRSVG